MSELSNTDDEFAGLTLRDWVQTVLGFGNVAPLGYRCWLNAERVTQQVYKNIGFCFVP